MNKLARLIRSFNETHRICTHDISGHLHLLRYCIDEYSEQLTAPNPLVSKMDEAITKLEEMNKLWKVSTRFHDPALDNSPESIVEKALGLTSVYFKKFVPNLDYKVKGNTPIESDKGTLLVELIFAFTSAICQHAVIHEHKNVEFLIEFHTNLENRIELSIRYNFNVEKEFIDSQFCEGDENERTLRRHNAVECLHDNDGNYEIINESSGLLVRIII